MLPLAFSRCSGAADRRAGIPLLALAVALCLLSPHVQTTYYLLIAAATVSLYLTFGERAPIRYAVADQTRVVFVAVVVGFRDRGAADLCPSSVIPHSPREGYSSALRAHVLRHSWNQYRNSSSPASQRHRHILGNESAQAAFRIPGPSVMALASSDRDGRRRLVWWTAASARCFSSSRWAVDAVLSSLVVGDSVRAKTRAREWCSSSWPLHVDLRGLRRVADRAGEAFAARHARVG